MKKLLTYLSVLFLFAVYSCHTETDIQVSSMLKKGICPNSTVVKMQLNNMIEGDQDTKSIVEIGTVEAFQNAMLFCMNPGQNGTIDDSDLIWKNGENEGYYHYTEERVINWPLPWDSSGSAPFVIYVLVNVGNYDQELVSSLETKATNGTLTVGDLKNIVYESPSIMSFKTIETENKGLPQAGVSDKITLTTEVQTETINVYAKCLYAKYEFWLRTESLVDAGYTELQGKYAYANTNTKVYPFIDNYSVPHTSEGLEQMMIQDLATAEDIAALENWTAGNAICLYVLENCQGTDNSNTKWYNQSSITNKEYKNSIAFGIKGKTPEGKSFEADYAVYLGTGNNACVKDFNVVRNWHGTLRISITSDLIDRPQYGIKFTPTSAIQVAPGESVTVPFETSESDINNIDFAIYEQDGTTRANGISITASNLIQKVSGTYQYSELGYAGTVTLTAQADANEGTYDISGKMSGNQGVLTDNADLEVTMAASLLKDVECLTLARYLGQWSVYSIPDEFFNHDDNYISLQHYYLSGSNYVYDSTRSCGTSIQNNSNTFVYGQTGVNKPHIWYDYVNKRLFVYCTKGYHSVDNYYKLTFLLYDENNDGDMEEVAKKSFTFTQKMPVLAFEGLNGGNELTYKTWIDSEGHRSGTPDINVGIVDRDTKTVIDRENYEWGVAPRYTSSDKYYAFPGLTWATYKTTTPGFNFDNFLTETHLYFDVNEADIEDRYNIYCGEYRDEGAMDWDTYNYNFVPKVKETWTNEYDYSSIWSHTWFEGECYFIPQNELVAAPVRTIKILEAKPGTNNYSDMKPSLSEAEDEFYLIYGIKKTFFIKLENLSETPTVTLDKTSENRPYLNYSVTATSDPNIYRLDFWIGQYENPLSFDDTATPYKTEDFDNSSGDLAVNITISSKIYVYGTGYITRTKEIECLVLHKRFELAYNYAKKDFEINWNPFGLIISGSKNISTVQRQYSWDPDEYGLITRTVQAYIPIALPYTNAFPTYNNSLVNELKAPAYILSVYGADGELVQHIHDISGKTFPYNAKTKLVNGDDEIGYSYYLIDDRIVNEEFRALYSQTTHITPIPIAVKIPNDFVSGEVTLSFGVDGISEKGCSLTGDVNDLRNYISVPPYVSISYSDSGQYDCYYCIGTNYVPVSVMDQNIAYYELGHSQQRTSFNNVKNDADLILEYEGMQHRYGGIPFPSFTGKFAFQKYPTASATQHPLIATEELSSNHIPSDYKDKLATPIQFRSARTNGCLAPIKVTNGNHVGEEWSWYPNDPVIVH